MSLAPHPPSFFHKKGLALKSSVSIKNLRKLFTTKTTIHDSAFPPQQKSIFYGDDFSQFKHNPVHGDVNISMESPASVEAPTLYSMDVSIDTTFTEHSTVDENDNDDFSYVSAYSSIDGGSLSASSDSLARPFRTVNLFGTPVRSTATPPPSHSVTPLHGVTPTRPPSSPIRLFETPGREGGPIFVPANKVIASPPQGPFSPSPLTLIDDAGFNHNFIPSAPPAPPVPSYASAERRPLSRDGSRVSSKAGGSPYQGSGSAFSPKRINSHSRLDSLPKRSPSASQGDLSIKRTSPYGTLSPRLGAPLPHSLSSFLLPPFDDGLTTPPRRTFSSSRVKRFFPHSPSRSKLFRTQAPLPPPVLAPTPVTARGWSLRPTTPVKNTLLTCVAPKKSLIDSRPSTSENPITEGSNLFVPPTSPDFLLKSVASKGHTKTKSAFGGELMVLEFFSSQEKAILRWSWDKNIRATEAEYALQLLVFGAEEPLSADEFFFNPSYDLLFTKFKSIRECFAALEFWDYVYERKLIGKYHNRELVNSLPSVGVQARGSSQMHEFKGITAVFCMFMDHLDSLDHFVDIMGPIGRVHGRIFGANTTKFDLLGALIIESLKDYFGENRFTPELQQLWARVYQYVCDLMLQSVAQEGFAM